MACKHGYSGGKEAVSLCFPVFFVCLLNLNKTFLFFVFFLYYFDCVDFSKRQPTLLAN